MMHFVGHPRSPWTERARWALDHHGIPYRYKAYQSVLDAPWLRFFSRTPFGSLDLPVLRDRRQLVWGSFQIVQHAEREGTRARLIPDVTAIVAWNELSNRAIVAGRSLAGRRLQRDDAEASLRQVLEKLSAALATGGTYLLRGRFSYADIAMATALQLVRPVDDAYLPIGPASRACSTHEALARDFGHLLGWRDGVYARHRRTAICAGDRLSATEPAPPPEEAGPRGTPSGG